MTELEQYISSYFGVTQQEIAAIAALFHQTRLQKGEYFLRQDQICTKLSFQRSGLLRVFTTTFDKEVTQWIGTSGYFMTDLSGIIFNKPSKWTIQALVDCEFYTIDRDDYNNIARVVPRWHQLEKLFIARCFTLLEDRIFTLLSMSAEERYQLLLAQNSPLFNQVPLQYLASMMGMTPETLSRLRKKTIK